MEIENWREKDGRDWGFVGSLDRPSSEYLVAIYTILPINASPPFPQGNQR
jgi:hypothetical protein